MLQDKVLSSIIVGRKHTMLPDYDLVPPKP